MDDLSQVNGKLDAIMESLSKSCMEENTSRKIPLSLKVMYLYLQKTIYNEDIL